MGEKREASSIHRKERRRGVHPKWVVFIIYIKKGGRSGRGGSGRGRSGREDIFYMSIECVYVWCVCVCVCVCLLIERRGKHQQKPKVNGTVRRHIFPIEIPCNHLPDNLDNAKNSHHPVRKPQIEETHRNTERPRQAKYNIHRHGNIIKLEDKRACDADM